MELKDNLPLPVTEQDKSFMTALLDAVKAKRAEATKKKNTREEASDGRHKIERHVLQPKIAGKGRAEVE